MEIRTILENRWADIPDYVSVGLIILKRNGTT